MVKKFIILVFAISISFLAQAQSLWKDISEQTISVLEGERQIVPTTYRVMQLDFKGMKAALSNAPTWQPGLSPESTLMVSLPTPDGGMETFKVMSASIFAPALAAKYPNIKSYKGWGIDDPTASLRFDISPQGFHAMVMSANGSWYVDPYAKNNTANYVVYHKKNYENDEPFFCGVESVSKLAPNDLFAPEYGDCQFRTYRLALACTGEYAQFHGGTVSGVLAAMNTSMTRVNGVYEREFAITMVIVANNDQIVFLDANTDPYTNNDGETMLDENQATVDNVIGSANYDVGHVFSTGGGGIAALESPCSSYKARGVTGRSAPVGDPFDIDYVAHEMGHQFGANHTQSNACNRNDPTAMEPGSASTIMGYAGICFPNVQSNSDDYFHTISMQEIHNNITSGSGSTCPTTTSLTNQAPTVDGGADYTIPVSTPFVLTGVGADGDNDPITYCWEQMDPEAATMPPEATATGGPVFRSINPTTNPKRYFPALADIITNTTTDWEVLPSVSRTLRFRVTVRDLQQDGGCIAQDDVVLTTAAEAGPFLVTQPNTNVDWSAQSVQTVTWDVAGTNAPPVNATSVDVLLSLDGGNTYPITLASATPNDGSVSVTMPAQTTTTARIMVKANGNIFFDISNTNFTISEAQTSFAVALSTDSVSICAPSSASLAMDITPIAGFTGDVTIAATGLPAGLSISYDSQTVSVPGSSNITLTAESTLSSNFVITFDVTGSTGTVSKELFVMVANSAPQVAELVLPINGDVDVDVMPVLKWTPVANTESYLVELFSDNNLTNLVESKLLQSVDSMVVTSNLNPASTYYWRVTTSNLCQANIVSEVDSFTTKAIFCNAFVAGDIPIIISSTTASTITSTIPISSYGILTAIKVKNLDVTHSWVNDLVIKLKGPDGTEVLLLNNICNGEDNILINFDDDATNPYTSIPCPPTGGETYQPLGSLNSFLDKNIHGDWTLTIEDGYSEDGGQLNGWGLDFCYLVDSLTMMVDVTDVSCFGGSNGSAEVIAAGGAQPYAYAWSSASNTGLSAGPYSVTVTDANGKSVSSSFVVSQPLALVLEASITDANPGASDGAIDLLVIGGVPTYSYNWSNTKTTQDIDGLAANTYVVTVTDANNCVSEASYVVGESCAIPSSFSVEILGSSSAMVSWGALTGVSNYQIRYRVVGATTWLAQTVSGTSVTLTDLTAEATYEYQVQANCTSGWSAYSDTQTFVLPAPCDAPINVSTVTVSDDVATLSWDALPNATGYVVNYRKLGSTLWLSQSTTSNSITISGLDSTTSYEVIVQTQCGSFLSSFNDTFVFTTMQGCSPPSNIVATNLGYQSFKLEWDAVSGVSLYSVRYRVVSTINWASINTSDTTIILAGLEAGATYEYQIQSKCGVPWSDLSLLAQNALPTGCLVNGLVASNVSSTVVELDWEVTNSASKYLISYGLAVSSNPLETLEVTTNSGSISDLQSNSVYSISVKAYCEFGWGAPIDITVQTAPDGLYNVERGKPFVMYPNPAHASLSLEFTEVPTKILIYNALGQILLERKGAFKMKVSLDNMVSGLYFVRAFYKDGTETAKKFMKE